MSHELRTPLNSLLILAKLLADNADGNLTDKQVEFAKTIHASGADLLALINDILDLSKIESGTMAVDVGDVALRRPARVTSSAPSARWRDDKGLEFDDRAGDRAAAGDLTPTRKRLQQVLKNLLSNAFKFTEQGSVTLQIEPATERLERRTIRVLNRAAAVVAFSVTDTGIGIPQDKQRIIFEAFQQADGTTSRKYGGTGLGLSISREIARLLGGEIRVESEPGKGSTFTLYLPLDYVAPRPAEPTAQEDAAAPAPSCTRLDAGPDAARALPDAPAGGSPRSSAPAWTIEDDRALHPAGRSGAADRRGRRRTFAGILLRAARAEQGFKGWSPREADGGAGAGAQRTRPAAITLDMDLPDMDGLDGARPAQARRRDPPHPGAHPSPDERPARARLKLGAIGYLQKPATRRRCDGALERSARASWSARCRSLLVVEDDEASGRRIVELLGNERRADDGGGHRRRRRSSALRERRFDCMVLDLGLPDMAGSELIEQHQASDGAAATCPSSSTPARS